MLEKAEGGLLSVCSSFALWKSSAVILRRMTLQWGEGARWLNAETPRPGRSKLRAQGEEKLGEEGYWLDCDENIQQGSMDSYYCQALLLMGIVRTAPAEVEGFEGFGGIETVL